MPNKSTKTEHMGKQDQKLIDFVFFAINQHDIVCNQKYDKTLPYSFHLHCVADQFEKYKGLVSEEKRGIVRAAIYGHDLQEDARLSHNDIVQISGSQEVADIIYCCTEEKGRNRAERHSEKYYKELSENKLACFVKLCDIIANVKYSILVNSSMLDKYKKEQEKNKAYLWHPEYKEMFEYLDKLFDL